MTTPKNLYIDSDGIKRGYYVYLHKDHVTGDIFYVGKGYDRRAWDSERRNDEWKKKVSSLLDGWDIEIVEDNLSEIEAFELEAELVDRYGGTASNGGKLTNWLPGGEHPVSISISFPLDDNGWSAAYYEARSFKVLPRREQEEIAVSVTKQLKLIIDRLSCLEEKADANEDENLSDIVSNVEIIIGSLSDTSSDFIRHRISWKDFGIGLEDTLDELEWEMEDTSEQHPKVLPLFREAIKTLKEFFSKVDSGNRKEAKEFANMTTQRK
jgi:hypothetical protein